jgi:hypothetical protein
MGFISSSSTVAVTAVLTEAGKEKLFNSIETTNEPFATKFALGDSDANYEAIAGGFSVLRTGFVPEPSAHFPRIKSFLLSEGTYRPFVPNIKLGGAHQAENFMNLAVTPNKESILELELRTSWPLGTVYEEAYDISIQPPDAIVGKRSIKDFITVDKTQPQKLIIKFNAVPAEDIEMLLGDNTNRNATATVAFKIIGKTSGAVSILYLDLNEF